MGGGWRRGASAGGRLEGGARGKAGTGLEARGSRGAGEGLRLDGPNVVLWSWEVGAVAVAAAGVGISGWERADMVL